MSAGDPKTTTDGEPPADGHWDATAPKPVDQSTGQHGSYWCLPQAERDKGFVRPLRKSYIHETCGALTTMGDLIAETYARQPTFYGRTFCVKCKDHFPVGADGEFVWDGTGPAVQTVAGDYSGFEKVGT